MNTLSALFNKYKAIPIVNENDTTSIEGIRLGENDKLAALVATKVDADLLILLSDIDGFFTADPRKNKNAQLIEVVHEISPEIEIFATGPASSAGTGGMRTKLNAAKIAIDAGIYMVIANGTIEHIIPKILNGERVGTLFIPKAEKMSHHKMWITHVLSPQGQIVVTEGARKAIQQDNASLLPIGIESLMGNFFFGDVVSLLDYGGEEFARGLVNYSAAELHRIQGKTSEEISKELGYQYNEVIHRNNLVILRNDS
jgi:glutamate 5-kinase